MKNVVNYLVYIFRPFVFRIHQEHFISLLLHHLIPNAEKERKYRHGRSDLANALYQIIMNKDFKKFIAISSATNLTSICLNLTQSVRFSSYDDVKEYEWW